MERVKKIAAEIKCTVSQTQAAIQLLEAGHTVPFIARYRKEATCGLSDLVLRVIEEKLYQQHAFEARRQAILKILRTHNHLTNTLERAIQSAETKAQLEDLYLPYRPHRRTKAELATAAGSTQLADRLFEDPTRDPWREAKAACLAEHTLVSEQAALEGAQHILIERIATTPTLLEWLRTFVWQHATLHVQLKKTNKPRSKKYQAYRTFRSTLHRISAHHALALLRGRRDGLLHLSLVIPEEAVYQHMKTYFGMVAQARQADAWLEQTIHLAWERLIKSKLEVEAFARLKTLAEEEAVTMMTRHLRAHLLTPPIGEKVVMGIEAGVHHGMKVCVLDKTGDILDTAVLYPFGPHSDKEAAMTTVAKYLMRHAVEWVAIGCGEAAQAAERLVNAVAARYADLTFSKRVVNRSVLADVASHVSCAERDSVLQGAIAIARQLQDPLATFAQLDLQQTSMWRSLHEVSEARLSRSVAGVVQDCVSTVGVNVNTASISLLSKVSGLNEDIAKQLVAYRALNGPFCNREQLKTIPTFSEQVFEQAAGFLMIPDGEEVLDATGVHPADYETVRQMSRDRHQTVKEMVGNAVLLKTIPLAKYEDATRGLPTLQAILHELEVAGHDPRVVVKTQQIQPRVQVPKKKTAAPFNTTMADALSKWKEQCHASV